jgi:hypothetical protein
MSGKDKRRPDEVAGGANQPQHLVGDYGEKPASSNPVPPATGHDPSTIGGVTDPHPSNEEHYDLQERPGGANPPRDSIGPNDAVHDGKPQKRPPPRPGAPG